MSAVGNPHLLLFLPLLLLQGSSANPVTAPARNHSTTQSSTHARIIFETGVHLEDYSYEDTEPPEVNEDLPPKVKGEVPPPQLCDYDLCRDQQTPCAKLSQSSGCMCPGVSGPSVLPQPPRLKSLIQVESGVEVQWCAPASTVLQYWVTVQGINPVTFGELSRQGMLGNLEAGASVCVEAVNRAGSSGQSEHSCSRFEPQEADRLAFRVGLIAGGLGLLLVLSVSVLLLWRRRTCHKEESSAEGLGNPSYSADGTM